jgi:hypothetical protein
MHFFDAFPQLAEKQLSTIESPDLKGLLKFSTKNFDLFHTVFHTLVENCAKAVEKGENIP